MNETDLGEWKLTNESKDVREWSQVQISYPWSHERGAYSAGLGPDRQQVWRRRFEMLLDPCVEV